MEWEKITIFCEKNGCGDPVPSFSDETKNWQKRRMDFVGIGFLDRAIFQCPVCHRQKRFRKAVFGGYKEVRF